MAQDRTAQFDLLVQVSEAELNAQLEAATLAGDLLPPEIIMPIQFGPANGTLTLNLRIPVLDLDRPRPRIGLRVDFVDSQAVFTAPVAVTIAPLNGTIEIVDRVQIRTDGNTQQAVIDFADGAPTVTVTLTPDTLTVLQPVLVATGLTQAQVVNTFAARVQELLTQQLVRLPLTPPIPIDPNNEAPFVVNGFDVTTVNDQTATDRDALTFGVRTSTATGGNINLVTQSFIPSGESSMVMAGNHWLLFRVIRPALASALGIDPSAIHQPCHLAQSVPFQGATLTNLDAVIDGNRIRVDGRATDSGTGWSAVSTFRFFVSLALAGGNITITTSEPEVDTDIDEEWWVWLVSVFVPLGPIIVAIVDAIAESVVDGLIGSGISEAAAVIPPIPLGPIGSSLNLTSIVLDDLEMRGSITRSLDLPIRSSGSLIRPLDFWLDLDDGTIEAGDDPSDGADLIASPTGIAPGYGAEMAVLGGAWDSTTPVDLERAAFGLAGISTVQIPMSPFDVFGSPFPGFRPVLLGFRTDEGRFAKVELRRSLDGQLRGRWLTYDRQVPTLDIVGRWDFLPTRGPASQIVTPKGPCTTQTVARKGTFRARARLMSYPIDYQWCLCGEVLHEGEGQVQASSGLLKYTLAGGWLTITTALGQSVDCDLCVSAIDSRERELFTCTPLSVEGTETSCQKVKIPRLQKRDILRIPSDDPRATATWEPATSPTFQARIRAALRAERPM